MNPLHNVQNEAKQIRLSQEEKAVMRAHIFGTESPISVTKSPYVTVSHYHWFSARFTTVMAALLVVMLGGGTVYASQGALPGDVLYAVKVSVAEPVREALAFSDEAKLSVHTDLAEERLEEAQALAAEGRLSAEAAAQIETSLEVHVEEAEALAVKVEEANPEVAAEVSGALEAALSVNSAILASLGDESDDDDTKQNSHSLANKTQSRIAYGSARNAGGMGGEAEAMSLMAPGADAEDPNALMATNSISADTSTSEKVVPGVPPVAATATEVQIKSAAHYEKRAEKAVSEVRASFTKLQASYDASTAARIALELESLDERLSTGDELETLGDYGAAKDLYVQVYKDATALATFLKAEQKFNKKILNALINERFGVRSLEIKAENSGEAEAEKGRTGDVQGTSTDGGESRESDGRSEQSDERDGNGNKEEESSKGSGLPIKVDLGL